MPNRKKHFSRWFTTANMRAINLDLVTDISFHHEGEQITGATVYQALIEGDGQVSVHVPEADARAIFDLLES